MVIFNGPFATWLYRKPDRSPEAEKHPCQKVYYCEPTGEIFTNYEDYFERRVLLDTEVWSCSVTGKSNLTYDEARGKSLRSDFWTHFLESESGIRKTLSQVDKTLSRAILYLFTKAPGRISAKTVSTEVFEAVKVGCPQRKIFKIFKISDWTL